MPFHKGHEAMIQFAKSKADFLTILICCSDKETIPSLIRKKWIANTFGKDSSIEIKIFDYKENEFPNTSVSSVEVSKLWATKFKEIFPDYSLLITSEPYGQYVADHMDINHILFDQERKSVPISASGIRENSAANWRFLPNAVKSFYARKVVILGTESTGKTTLANDLANHFKATLVLEAGREVIKDSTVFSFEDLITTAKEHANKINMALNGDSPLIIIDTDVYITQSYSTYFFGKELELSEDIYETNKAHLYLYLNNDVAYIQDGTRLSEIDRNNIELSHRKIIERYKLPIHEIKGNWSERFNTAVALIENLLNKK